MQSPQFKQIGWREAESIVGHRVDRRRRYGRYGRRLEERISFTASCSGCFEGGEYMGLAHHYPYDQKAQCYVGTGCHECGYQGKVRRVEWVPYTKPVSI